jgi:DNA-binding response OmpR family regulator
MRENNIPLTALDSGKRKVLVVDDDKELVELLVDVFSRDPRFEVRTASSGYQAGMLTQQFHPDIILLDYMLPDINGNVVCQTIKSNPEFANTQIVIVSGVIAQDEIDNLLKAGACEFVRKPFRVADLVAKVASILKME